jgi:hypothetical protein
MSSTWWANSRTWRTSSADRQLAQSQIAEVQGLGLGSSSLLDPPLGYVLLHDG